MATKKQEEKINRLWKVIQKHGSEDIKSKLNMRAFLYSVGRLTYEDVLIELVSVYYGKDLDDEELLGVKEILNGKTNTK